MSKLRIPANHKNIIPCPFAGRACHSGALKSCWSRSPKSPDFGTTIECSRHSKVCRAFSKPKGLGWLCRRCFGAHRPAFEVGKDAPQHDTTAYGSNWGTQRIGTAEEQFASIRSSIASIGSRIASVGNHIASVGNHIAGSSKRIAGGSRRIAGRKNRVFGQESGAV